MCGVSAFSHGFVIYLVLSYDIASGSEITPGNRIDKPLLFYRFSGKVMISITTLHTYV